MDKEVKELVEGVMENPRDRRILSYIYNHPEESITYEKLWKVLNYGSSSTIGRHIAELTEDGLIASRDYRGGENEGKGGIPKKEFFLADTPRARLVIRMIKRNNF